MGKKKEKSEGVVIGGEGHKNYIDMEVYLSDIKRYRETAETQKMLLDKIVKENEELKEENKKLKDRIAELEKCNLNLQGHIDRQNRGYEPQFENGFPKYKLLNHKQ